MMPRLAFRDLRLFWKLLVPFVALLLIVGAFGAFLIVRDLSSRARATLNEDLARSSLEARAELQHRELYLLDSVNLAANLQGMAQAVARSDTAEIARLLRSVVALKSDLDLVVITSSSGRALVEFARGSDSRELRRVPPTSWKRAGPVRATLEEARADKHPGVVEGHGGKLFAVASPICTAVRRCDSAGVALVALRAGRLAAEISSNPARALSARAGLAIYDERGALLAASGGTIPQQDTDARPTATRFVRRSVTVDGVAAHLLYAPFEMAGERVGIIAIGLPSDPVFASVRTAALRLTFLMLTVLVGIMGLGALISRQILRQVRPLVETNRALGAGDLSARAPVLTRDEIGEVARGLNQMAEQLQASHETLEMRVAQRTDEIARLLADRTEFFASLSHELRTPLAIILNEADALLDNGHGTKATSARAIKLSGAQLLAVVNDILELAKAEVGRLEISPVIVDLREAISELQPTFEGLARSSELTLDVEVAANLPPASADPYRLREILLNLVDNAIKYTPAGGRVFVTARAQDTSVRVSVSDTGPGIPPEIGDRVFEPFFRVPGTSTRRERASSGLGLALTRRLVEAHGGTIWFEPSPQDGTTFSFTLPLARETKPTRRGRSLRTNAVHHA